MSGESDFVCSKCGNEWCAEQYTGCSKCGHNAWIRPELNVLQCPFCGRNMAEPSQGTIPTKHSADCSTYDVASPGVCDCGYLLRAISDPRIPEDKRPYEERAKHLAAIEKQGTIPAEELKATIGMLNSAASELFLSGKLDEGTSLLRQAKKLTSLIHRTDSPKGPA